MLMMLLPIIVVQIIALQITMLISQRNIMTKISEFSAAVQASFAQINVGIAGVQADVENLKSQIAALQNSNTELSPEDEALLGQIQATAQAAADKLSALDALTPPAGGEPATGDVGNAEGADANTSGEV